jgi:DNA-binding XRE family transcriptional regulator
MHHECKRFSPDGDRRLIMKFGDKIKEQRKKAGLYQEDVTKAIGVTKRTLINYEGGISYPQDRSV